ncbi:hypothetical protein [Methylopila sp. 73B]|uniref:hypothetical protein n=1 Tax=Methylopila sp. 73B TaxID=1120792 RepID=UPI0012DDF330|nr:hypothetical protein [Methylopila sp. 73B]
MKGALGAVVVAVGGYLGAAAMQVLSAPKDSVAYDLIQSMTGWLKPKDEPAPARDVARASPSAPVEETPSQGAAAAVAASVPATPSIVGGGAQPTAALALKIDLPGSPGGPAASPAAKVDPTPEPQAAPSAEPAPPGSMLDRVRRTTELAAQTRARTAALGASRVITLADRARTPICGADYRIEVTSVAAGAGRVALTRADGSGAPLTLAAGEAPRVVSAGCQVALLSAADDLSNRRAQLRETRLD